jgi:hypothetical protein
MSWRNHSLVFKPVSCLTLVNAKSPIQFSMSASNGALEQLDKRISRAAKAVSRRHPFIAFRYVERSKYKRYLSSLRGRVHQMFVRLRFLPPA